MFRQGSDQVIILLPEVVKSWIPSLGLTWVFAMVAYKYMGLIIKSWRFAVKS